MYTGIRKKNNYYKYPLVFITGFLLSGAVLFGENAPFCAALIGSLSGFGCVAAFVGIFIGYAMQGDILNFVPTIVSLIAISCFKIIIGNKNSKFFISLSSGLTGACVLISGFLSADIPSDLLNSFAFAIIAIICTYSLYLSYEVFLTKRYFSMLNPLNTAALGIIYTFCIAAMTGYDFGIVNIGLICAVFMTLSFAKKYRYSGGAICGAVSAIGVSVANPEYVVAALVICVAGLTSSLFKKLQAAGFIFSAGVFAALLGVENFSWSVACAVVIGSFLFLVLPIEHLTEKFNRKPYKNKSADINEIYSNRLRLIGSAMGEVKFAVDKTAEILDKKSNKNNAWIYNSACDDVCRKCRYNMECWGNEYNDTVRSMEDLTKTMRTGKQLKQDDLPYNILSRCTKKEQLIHTLMRQFREYIAISTANRKLAEMRTILTAQLSATEKMFETMADDFLNSSQYDRVLAAKTEVILGENGIIDPKAAILIKDSRLSIEAYGKGKLVCEENKLCDLLSATLKHEFDPPNIIYNNGYFKLTMYERTVFSIEYGAFQLGKGKEKNCGDYYDNFIDGQGNAYIILSDGMGSGSRARIDSAFACGMIIKLLQAGIGLDSAIEIINNSLLVKSSDESFATLDICRIDLYTGKITLFKAGSAPTYIKCNKRIVKANGRGLPIGISSKPTYESQSFTIGNSDVVIMTSDGAELSEQWLEHELNKDDALISGMKGVAESVAMAAKFASEKGREDDISVIAVKLVK